MESWKNELYSNLNAYSLTLSHHGIKGQKWGQRNGPPYPLSRQSRFGGNGKNKSGSVGAGRTNYRSRGLRAAIARRKNEKIDKSFKKWKEETQKKEDAIELGKRKNEALLAYESDRSNKELKKQYKDANRDYKKSVSKNTTYRKGVVRQEVEKDLSRKYMSKAKQIEKEFKKDPSNKELRKQYESFMSKHDIERDRARREVNVSRRRMYKQASIKRGITIAIKGAAATASIAIGVTFYNKYISKGRNNLRIMDIRDLMDLAKKGRRYLAYLRF